MQRTGTAMLHSEELEATAEAAVLFAANFVDAAIAVLEAQTARPPGGSNANAWRMLLEVYHLNGMRSEFDSLAARYRFSVDTARTPTWGYPAAVKAPGMLCLKGVIASSRDLEALVEHGRTSMTVAIDMSELHRIEFGYAIGFCEVLRHFQGQRKRIILANIGELHATLLETLGMSQDVILLRRNAGRSLDADAMAERRHAHGPAVRAA